jgi:hypothetical protein
MAFSTVLSRTKNQQIQIISKNANFTPSSASLNRLFTPYMRFYSQKKRSVGIRQGFFRFFLSKNLQVNTNQTITNEYVQDYYINTRKILMQEENWKKATNECIF